MSERQYNEERYNELKVEGDDLKNAAICDKIAPDKSELENQFSGLNIDEMLAEELEERIIDNIKAGFLSNDEILKECEEYIEEAYPEESTNISSDELLEAIVWYRNKFQNTGDQENFLKLDLAFKNLDKQGIVSLHCAGYVQADGFDDCNEIAAERHKNGEKVIGCCFYTMQDLEHILHEESTLLYFSFGNYFDKPTAEEIGQIIVKEFEAVGFSTQWTQSADTKIAIKDLTWDKQYGGSNG